MGIDASHLRRGVHTQTQGATGELVDHFESLKVQCTACAGEQGFDMLQEGRHHQLIAKTLCSVQAQTTQFFDVPGL